MISAGDALCISIEELSCSNDFGFLIAIPALLAQGVSSDDLGKFRGGQFVEFLNRLQCWDLEILACGVFTRECGLGQDLLELFGRL